MTCPECHKETEAITSRIISGKIITGCDNCLRDNINQQAQGAAKYHRDRQKEDYRKDITQPNQGRDFIRAYGVDKAREYMTDDTIRRLA
jgi:hypothetical protein